MNKVTISVTISIFFLFFLSRNSVCHTEFRVCFLLPFFCYHFFVTIL